MAGVGEYRSSIPQKVEFKGIKLGDTAEPVVVDWGFQEEEIRATNTGMSIKTILHLGASPVIRVSLYEHHKGEVWNAICAGTTEGGELDLTKMAPGFNRGANAAHYGRLTITPGIDGAKTTTFNRAIPSLEEMGEYTYVDNISIQRVVFKAILDGSDEIGGT